MDYEEWKSLNTKYVIDYWVNNRKDSMDSLNEFPSNSKRNKERQIKKPEEEKKVEKVIKGDVVEKKPPFMSRMKETFFGGEAKSAMTYILAEVLLPAARNMIVEATSRGIERMVYGDKPSNRSADPRRGRMSYNTPVDRFSSVQRGYLPGQPGMALDRVPAFNEIVLRDQEDAEAVVSQLCDILSQFNVASVADLKELVGLPSTYTDNSYGWTDVRFIDVQQVRDGWLIDVPRPKPI